MSNSVRARSPSFAWIDVLSSGRKLQRRAYAFSPSLRSRLAGCTFDAGMSDSAADPAVVDRRAYALRREDAAGHATTLSPAADGASRPMTQYLPMGKSISGTTVSQPRFRYRASAGWLSTCVESSCRRVEAREHGIVEPRADPPASAGRGAPPARRARSGPGAASACAARRSSLSATRSCHHCPGAPR